MENAPQRTEASSPWRIEDLLVMVAAIHDMLSQEQIEMVMTVLMNEIINQVEIATIKTIDK